MVVALSTTLESVAEGIEVMVCEAVLPVWVVMAVVCCRWVVCCCCVVGDADGEADGDADWDAVVGDCVVGVSACCVVVGCTDGEGDAEVVGATVVVGCCVVVGSAIVVAMVALLLLLPLPVPLPLPPPDTIGTFCRGLKNPSGRSTAFTKALQATSSTAMCRCRSILMNDGPFGLLDGREETWLMLRTDKAGLFGNLLDRSRMTVDRMVTTDWTTGMSERVGRG